MQMSAQEAAQQILVSVSDLHGVLALEDRQDLMGPLGDIRQTAAGILKMELSELDVRESARRDMMRAIGSLGHAINSNLADWPNFNGEETVLIIRMAECCVKRGQAWLDMVAKADDASRNAGYLKNFEVGCDDEIKSDELGVSDELSRM